MGLLNLIRRAPLGSRLNETPHTKYDHARPPFLPERWRRCRGRDRDARCARPARTPTTTRRRSSRSTSRRCARWRSRAGIAWWNANTTGKDEDFKKKEEAQNKIDAALSDTKTFAALKALKAAADKGEIDDPVVARQIDVLYLQYLEKQVDPELLKKITAKANAVEQAFNVFRAKVDGKEMTDSEVRKIAEGVDRLGTAAEGVGGEQGRRRGRRGRPRRSWSSSATRRRRKLGFKNYHALQLTSTSRTATNSSSCSTTSTRSPASRSPKAKAEIDERLAEEAAA